MLCGWLLFSGTLLAGVNLKNGNFYISYTDHSFSKTSGFEILRTYNSKSIERGLFGFGWGSEIETRLFAIGDGTIFIKEHGSGANTFFDGAQADEEALTEAINRLIQAALEKGDLENNPGAISAYRQKLRNNREERATRWKKYLQAGLLQAPDFSAGTRWVSTDRGNQRAERTATGYRRTYSDGSYDVFDEQGLMAGKYTKDNQPRYIITYNRQQQINTVADRNGNKFVFRFTRDGKLSQIQSSLGISYYTFEGENLVKTVDVAGNTYRHEYDAVHNMTAIRYKDQTAMLIEYYNTNYFVKRITERDGGWKEYIYVSFYTEEGQVNDDRYATYVVAPNRYTGGSDSNYYEYEIRTKMDGSRYTYRILQRVGYTEKETVYSENCNNPLRIRNQDRSGTRTSTYAYNSFCLLTYKENNTSITRVTYDSLLRKIVRSEYTDKATSRLTVYSYRYNTNGDLVRADEDGKWVELSYDENNKISRMVYEDGVLEFEYNSMGKPILIRSEGKGSVRVTYKSNGEIDKTESDEGSSVAISITSAMQTLLARTRPRGLTFD